MSVAVIIHEILMNLLFDANKLKYNLQFLTLSNKKFMRISCDYSHGHLNLV